MTAGVPDGGWMAFSRKFRERSGEIRTEDVMLFLMGITSLFLSIFVVGGNLKGYLEAAARWYKGWGMSRNDVFDQLTVEVELLTKGSGECEKGNLLREVEYVMGKVFGEVWN